jgi:hypothetical protein
MGTLKMSSKERLRLELAGRVDRKELAVVKAAELAGISLRQMQRICKRHRVEGDSGLVHRSRGRHPNNRLPDNRRWREECEQMQQLQSRAVAQGYLGQLYT